MKSFSKWVGFVFAFNVFGLPLQSKADPILPNAYYSGDTGANTTDGAGGTNVTGPGFFTASQTGPSGTAFSQVRVFPSPEPDVAAVSSVSASCYNCYAQTYNIGNLIYGLEFFGPSAAIGTTISVHLDAYGLATSSLGSAATSWFSLQSGYDTALNFQADSQNGAASNGNQEYFNVSSTYQLLVNIPYTVILYASTNASAAGNGGYSNAASANAYVD